MNFLISICGWLLWNLAEMQISKAEKDNDNDPTTKLSLKEYFQSHWILWLGSLICIPVLLWIGYRNLDINPVGSLIGVETKAWHDLYILASGAAFEGFIFAVKKVRSFFAKKEKDL